MNVVFFSFLLNGTPARGNRRMPVVQNQSALDRRSVIINGKSDYITWCVHVFSVRQLHKYSETIVDDLLWHKLH